MKNTISKKYVTDYIVKTYGEMRHSAEGMVRAINETARAYQLNKKHLFHYIIERKSTIPMATSYGFDTAYGREIRETFGNYYNNKN